MDDGSCEFTSCEGCTDEEACNYDPQAVIDDGSCVFRGASTVVLATSIPMRADDGSCEYEDASAAVAEIVPPTWTEMTFATTLTIAWA